MQCKTKQKAPFHSMLNRQGQHMQSTNTKRDSSVYHDAAIRHPSAALDVNLEISQSRSKVFQFSNRTTRHATSKEDMDMDLRNSRLWRWIMRCDLNFGKRCSEWSFHPKKTWITHHTHHLYTKIRRYWSHPNIPISLFPKTTINISQSSILFSSPSNA